MARCGRCCCRSRISAHYLPYARVSFGLERSSSARRGPAPRSFLGIVSIKEYPGQTAPGMLDELLRLPFELTVSQSFGFVERQAALRADGPGAAPDALGRGRGGRACAPMLASARRGRRRPRRLRRASHDPRGPRPTRPATVDEGVAEAQAALADIGIIAVREEIDLEPAFWAQFPGNFKYIARRGADLDRQFRGPRQLPRFPAGPGRRQPLGRGGDGARDDRRRRPIIFNFHQGDLGNFTVIGPSGSGKTVVLNFLLAQARKFRPRTIFFDKDRGAEMFLRAIGGRYDVLRAGRADRASTRSAAGQRRSTARSCATGWRCSPAAPNDETGADQGRGRRQFRPAGRASPAALPRASCSAAAAGRSRATCWSRLEPWWGDGEHAWLFDNERDRTRPRRRVGRLRHDRSCSTIRRLRTPAMMYLFHRIEERLDGTAAIILVDEGWKALDDDVFVRRIRDWEKTIRKRNGMVGFATQSAQDALDSRIASAIIEQTATQIFMPNPKARADDYCEGFGLTAHEFELIRTPARHAHCFLDQARRRQRRRAARPDRRDATC